MFPDFLNAPQLWVAALLSPTGALMIAEWTGVLLAIAGALVMSMNRSYSRHAWLLWTLSNLLLILPIAHTQRWGLLAMQAAFLIVNVNGWWRHGRRTLATPSRPRSPRQRRAMTSYLPGGVAQCREFTTVGECLARAGRPNRLSRSPSPHQQPKPLSRSLDMADHKPPPTTLTITPTVLDEDRRYYVYQLADTHAPQAPLYIGKGTGRRLYDHAADARAYNAGACRGASTKSRTPRAQARQVPARGSAAGRNEAQGLPHPSGSA